MAKYQVFIPAKKDSEMPDITLSVEASNWLVALKESLKKMGEQGDALQNILCETGDDGSLRVADPTTKRVFVIKELADDSDDEARALLAEAEERAKKSREEAEAADAERAEAKKRLEDLKRQEEEAARAAEAARKAVEELAEAEAAAAERATREKAEADSRVQADDARKEAEAAYKKAEKKATQLAMQAAEDATGSIGDISIEEGSSYDGGDGYDDLDDWYDDDEVHESTMDEVLSDVFMATEDIYNLSEGDAANTILEQAMKYVEAEAGSVFLVNINTALQDLRIAAASGPIGDKIIGLTVPRGKGIVGFSALKSMRLIVNQANKNPNFYGKMDEEFGFKTRSLLCIPVIHESRLFGVIEMVNKKGADPSWTTNDGNLIDSLAALLGKVLHYQHSLVEL